ncbi:MAG: transcriptional repressor [Cyclonatronaceae bacterium]
MSEESKVRHIIQQSGLKVTDARISVLGVLMHSTVAMSHGDIKKRIGTANPDKVTLYRTLNTFVKSGLAHRVATEDRRWLYAHHQQDSNPVKSDHNHAHFICDDCERIYCLPIHSEKPITTDSVDGGFVIRSHEYRLHGLCPLCQ